jgi:hypothetical protein
LCYNQFVKIFKSPVLISAVVLLIFILGLYLGTKYNSPKESEDTTQTEPVAETPEPELLVDKSLSTDKTYTVLHPYTTFKVAYPQFKNATPDFNKKIAEQVNAGIEQQKKDSEYSWKARYETQSAGEDISQFPSKDDKFYYDVSWQATQENNRFISFLLVTSAYAGGAHGYEVLSSFNYDVIKKQEITLADLFANDPDHLDTISEFSRKDLTAQFRKKLSVKTKDEEKTFQDSIVPMMLGGTTPDEINFSVFTFTDDNITFYFNQYQVAPYSMGLSKIVMSRN